MQKFIVTSDDRLKMGDVCLHKHLLEPGESCIGGGIYEWDYSAPTPRLLLSGRSYDFGRVRWDWVHKLRIPATLRGVEIMYEDLPISSFAEIEYLAEEQPR